MNHDQAFKNLILDYPAAALEFFAGASGLDGATITPVREEQLQEVLGNRLTTYHFTTRLGMHTYSPFAKGGSRGIYQ